MPRQPASSCSLCSLSCRRCGSPWCPTAVKRRRAGRLAREQFFAQGLHLTRARTGVLIFVSVAEHYVEIIADQGIDALVPPGTWDKAVADFVGQVRAGHIAEGFLAASPWSATNSRSTSRAPTTTATSCRTA